MLHLHKYIRVLYLCNSKELNCSFVGIASRLVQLELGDTNIYAYTDMPMKYLGKIYGKANSVVFPKKYFCKHPKVSKL